MQQLASDKLDRSDLYVLAHALILAPFRPLTRKNIRWAAMSLFTLHLGLFGLTDVVRGYWWRGLRRLLAPPVVAWLFFNVSGLGLLTPIVRLAALGMALWWLAYALGDVFGVVIGSIDLTRKAAVQEAEARRQPLDPVLVEHDFTGSTILGILALIVLYYQVLFTQLPRLPILPDLCARLWALLPVIGSAG